MMAKQEPKAWVVRGGGHGENDPWFLANNAVGIRFQEFPDLSSVASREQMKALALQVLPGAKERAAYNYAAQAWAFLARIEVGDLVILPLKQAGQLAIGRIAGDYRYLTDGPPTIRHARTVEWLRTDVPRTVVGQDLLYSIGAFSTVVQIQRNDAAYRK